MMVDMQGQNVCHVKERKYATCCATVCEALIGNEYSLAKEIVCVKFIV